MKRAYLAALVLSGLLFLVILVIGLALSGAARRDILVNWFPLAVFFASGAVAFLMRPDNRAARRLLLIGVAGAGFITSAAATVYVPAGWQLYLVQLTLNLLVFACWVAFCAVYPDGRYQARLERWVTQGVVAAAILLPLLSAVATPHLSLLGVPGRGPETVTAPFTVAGLAPLSAAYQLIWLSPVLGLILLIPRYRRSSGDGRRAMRWPLFAAGLAACFYLLSFLETVGGWNLGGDVVGTVLFVGTTSFLPVAAVIGMLRPSLLDIDLIIRRSPTYALLWLGIAGIYAGLAAILGLSAGRFSVPVAVLVTIVAAVLFQPARRRLERLADRMVFGRRLDSYELLRRLGGDLERTLAPGDVAPKVVEAVCLAVGARWARLRVSEDGELTTVAIFGAVEGGPAVMVPLANAGVSVGVLECGPKREGRYSDDDRELLAVVARQASLALHNVAQAREVAASRARILEAAEVERRRIERDLHDGVQQQLVALMARLELARLQVERDPARAAEALQVAKDVARSALTDVRQLARGIHPTVLDDEGLLGAIEARAALLPIGVAIEAEPQLRDQRFDQQVEAAAYFLVAEGLANVMKHSGSSAASVHLNLVDGELRVEVRDHGRGFDATRTVRRGLRGLADRLEALGGTLRVEAMNGRGTRLVGCLPVTAG